MIIWVASYPRSGNTFFRVLLKSLYGVESYSIYDDPLFETLGASDAVGHAKRTKSMDSMENSRDIYFVKTHELPHDDLPAIYLLRDGRAAMISFAHYIRDFEHTPPSKWERWLKRERSFEKIVANLITDRTRHGGWSGHVRAWQSRPKSALTIMIRYEDLIEDPLGVMTNVIPRIAPSLERSEISSIPTFSELQENWPQFFRRGTKDGWKQELSPALQNKFMEVHGEIMKSYGYID